MLAGVLSRHQQRISGLGHGRGAGEQHEGKSEPNTNTLQQVSNNCRYLLNGFTVPVDQHSPAAFIIYHIIVSLLRIKQLLNARKQHTVTRSAKHTKRFQGLEKGEKANQLEHTNQHSQSGRRRMRVLRLTPPPVDPVLADPIPSFLAAATLTAPWSSFSVAAATV